MIEDSCAAQYFCANCDTFQDLKEHNSCEIKIFCNINVFIVTFDQLNAFSLDKSINFIKKTTLIKKSWQNLNIWFDQKFNRNYLSNKHTETNFWNNLYY